MAFTAESRRHRASKPQGSSTRVLPWQVAMDYLIRASLSHTRYWYDVGMLKAPACMVTRMEDEYFFVRVSNFAPEHLISQDGFGSPVPRQPAHLHTQAESGAYLRNSSRVPWRRPFIYLKPPNAIGSVPSSSGRAIEYR